MDRAVLPGDPPVEVTVKRSAQARRFSLRVSRLDGRVTLSMPNWAPEREALAFLRAKEDWVRRSIGTGPQAAVVGFGAAVPVEGRMLVLTPGAVRAARIEGEALVLPADPARASARAAAYLKLAARQRLQAECDRQALALGRRFGQITLRDTRSRWGSCTAAGDLMFSWRLIMAPPEVLAYVAAHEVAHLAEMNHSAAFWAVVERLMPGYGAPRRWLKQQGGQLHAYRFG